MIIVFGSINIDLLMSVSSLPAPGETVLTHEMQRSPGGKGANQAIASQRAGSKTKFVGCVGSDSDADEALSLLRYQEVDISSVLFSDRSTGCAIVLVDNNGENMITVASGANLDIQADQVDGTELEDSSVLLLQQEVPLEQNIKLATRAHQTDTKVVYNFAPAGKLSEELFSVIDYLIVNEVEASTIMTPSIYDHPVEIAKTLCHEYGVTVVITLGSEGALAVSKTTLAEVPAPSVKVVDTTGSGDTFCGYFAAEIAKGSTSIESCLEVAIRAASVACTRYGAQSGIPHRHDVF
ncbi:MAG: ribokinase [Acidiferrobacteraceae bacterium]|nr:ribokinase [Acidiferrobacteraceae bacterium]